MYVIHIYIYEILPGTLKNFLFYVSGSTPPGELLPFMVTFYIIVGTLKKSSSLINYLYIYNFKKTSQRQYIYIYKTNTKK